jgi:hypothetical protein
VMDSGADKRRWFGVTQNRDTPNYTSSSTIEALYRTGGQ